MLSAESKLDEAIPLYRMSLEIRQNSLGEQHLVVATSLNNLAISLKRKGQYQEAEEAYSRSLAIREGLLGEDHVSVAQSLHNLAALKDAMGDHEEAEQLYRRAIDASTLPRSAHLPPSRAIPLSTCAVHAPVPQCTPPPPPSTSPLSADSRVS